MFSWTNSEVQTKSRSSDKATDQRQLRSFYWRHIRIESKSARITIYKISGTVAVESKRSRFLVRKYAIIFDNLFSREASFSRKSSVRLNLFSSLDLASYPVTFIYVGSETITSWFYGLTTHDTDSYLLRARLLDAFETSLRTLDVLIARKAKRKSCWSMVGLGRWEGQLL